MDSQLQIVLTLKMKNINLQLIEMMISSNKIWHQDQQNPSRTQSISWLNVIRLFYSANIVLELISTTVADQRLLGWSIHWLTCFCSASTLDELIKLGHGHWCGSHVGSCLKRLLALTMDWFPPSSWHVEKQKPAISFIWDQSHRTDPHNCLMQLAHNLTGQPVCDPPTFKSLSNKYC